MRIKIPVFLITISLFSCNKAETQFEGQNIFLKNKGSIILPLDENSTYEFYMYQVVSDTLFVLNQINYSLDYYDLLDGELLGRIKVDKEGEYGISRLNSFHFYNKDSIFLFSQFQLNNSLIININGHPVGKVKTGEFQSDQPGLVNHVGTPSMPTLLIGDDLYFSIFPLTDEGIRNDLFVHEYSLNLKTGNFKSYDFILKPSIFHGKSWIDEIFSRVKNNREEWYYSWNLSDTVLHIKIEDNAKPIFKKIVLNGGIKTIPVPIDQNSSQETLVIANAKSYSYGKIFIDRQKDIIHRVRYLPIENSKIELIGSKNPYLEKDFEVLSARLNGEYLGTTYFKSGKYDPRLIFLGPRGLYLPKTHPSFNELSEDQVTYDIFQTN
jgi:hypothetical protein